MPPGTRIVADRLNAQKFYGLELFSGKLYLSRDGRASFSTWELVLPGGLPKGSRESGERGEARGGQDQIYCTPGRGGDLWLATFDGLFHSIDEGKSFIRQRGVQELHAFGFGKGAAGTASPALYLVGIVDGTRGIFRSDSTAQTSVRISDEQHQWGLILLIAGDPKQYGRVYVGTHGRGIVYGDPVKP